jgi:glycosyl transferase, family 25
LLDGLDYEFMFGADKHELENDTEALAKVYNESHAKSLHRYQKPMTIGHIACSLSHRKVYEHMLANGVKKALVFEDDVVPQFDALHHVPAILQELPPDWDMLYFGYDRNEKRTIAAQLKQYVYHLQYALGLMRWNHTMIRNLYARPYSKHLRIAGYHDLSHAYGITLKGATAMIEVQSPIAFNADTAIAWAVSNELIKGYITVPQIFMQEVQTNPDTYVSLVKLE